MRVGCGGGQAIMFDVACTKDDISGVVIVTVLVGDVTAVLEVM